ncbi:PspA/IM30 family protein [Tenacibaculum sp. C7A-26P2]|uniref:PspA/IM30 family protein n=1 Tax=Tenacibaculum sp. C7A-26P2 TaxID=3447504 RepID=UPI003F842022
MNIFKRLFRIGQAEAHSAINKMEDPIKMTEQGIRDLKDDLEKSIESLAQIKALAIRSRNELENYKLKAEDYQQKAMLILQKAKKGEIEASEADRLAKQALVKKEENIQEVNRTKLESDKLDASVTKLEKSVQEIKNNIQKWENELKTLKARVKVSKATKNLNQQMAELDSSSTVSMLEQMKDKVAQEEALADAYGDLANSTKTIDDELNDAVVETNNNAEDDLAKLKKQLGLNDKNEG